MKWSPTVSSSHCLMINPCLTEQGMGRTSMTLSAPMRFSVDVFMLLLMFCFGGWLIIANARHGPAGFCHHRGMPRRIPDDLNVHVGHAIERLQNVFHAFGNAVVHWTAGCGERHRHCQFVVGVGVAIDQAEVHNV